MIKGSCHCGALRYTLDDSPIEALRCNCSICRRKGHLLTFSTPEKFTFEGDESAISEYQFGSKSIHHQFCSKCGCSPFGWGIGPDGVEMVAINLNCADDFEPGNLKITEFDGASL